MQRASRSFYADLIRAASDQFDASRPLWGFYCCVSLSAAASCVPPCEGQQDKTQQRLTVDGRISAFTRCEGWEVQNFRRILICIEGRLHPPLQTCRPWLLNLHILSVYPILSSLCSISVIAPSAVKPSEIVAGEVWLPSTRVTIVFSSVCVDLTVHQSTAPSCMLYRSAASELFP